MESPGVLRGVHGFVSIQKANVSVTTRGYSLLYAYILR